jgi:hypothetical protein
MNRIIIISLIVFSTANALAKNTDKKLGLYGYLQLRNDYSATNLTVNDVYFKRLRIGIKGGSQKPPIDWEVLFHNDLLGKQNIPAEAAKIQLWHMFATWRISKENESLLLTAGTFLPRISRECVSSPFSMSSIEKSPATGKMRMFLLEKSNGIQPGLMLGGLIGSDKKHFYNVACQFIQTDFIASATVNPVFTARVTHMVLGREISKYQHLFSEFNPTKTNYLSVGYGLGVRPDLQTKNHKTAFGIDAAWAFNKFRLVCESYLYGTTKTAENLSMSSVMRFSGIITLNNNFIVEPVFSAWAWHNMAYLNDNAPIRELEPNVGINIYPPHKSLKIMLHYIYNNSLTSSGDRDSGFVVNNSNRETFAVLLQIKI